MDDRIDRSGSPITLESRPTLRPHVKFRHDPVRNRWVILAPERILTPNEEAVNVLQLCNGERTIAEIAATLAQTYDAEADTIASDILPVLQGLIESGVLRP